MKSNQSLVRSEVVAALKEAGVATKDDVRQIVGAELTAHGVATKDDLKEGLGKLERTLKRRMGQDRNKILATIGNLATHTPTLTAFRELKSKIDRSPLS